MDGIEGVFQLELIKLMKAVLDNAVATLPEAKRKSSMTTEIASQILARGTQPTGAQLSKSERDEQQSESVGVFNCAG